MTARIPSTVMVAAWLVCFLLIPLTVWTGVNMAALQDTRRAVETQARIECALHQETPAVEKLCERYLP